MTKRIAGSGRIALYCATLVLGASVAVAQVQVAAVAAPVEPAASQEDPIRGPMLGYTFNSRNLTLHPISGILGASFVGDPLLVGFSLRLAAVSPTQDYALAVDAESGEIKLINLTALPPNTQTVPAAVPSADRIVFSPRGQAALLFYRRARSVQILTGLPDRPSVRRSFELRSLPGVLTALAISDDGETALVATASNDAEGSVLVLSPQEEPRFVTPVGRALALAFLSRSQDALVADYDKNEILLVRDAPGSAQVISLAGESDGIVRPFAVAASEDGKSAIAASKASRRVTLIPLAGGGAASVSCRCEPTGLARLRGEGLFQLTSVDLGTIFVLDARTADPRVMFIPGNGGEASRPAAEPKRTPRSRAVR